jgi:hypothetical protein
MDKNVEAQRVANKYLEIEISDFKIQLQSDSKSIIQGIKEVFLVELEILEQCFTNRDYSHIDKIINDLLPAEFKLNTKHSAYKTLRYEFFQARIKAAQEMMEMCEGPHSYDFKGEDIDLVASLIKFFDRAPAVDKWKGQKQKKTQILVNELATEIRSKCSRTGVTQLAAEISDMDKMKSSENPIKYETIRKDYLDDFKN